MEKMKRLAVTLIAIVALLVAAGLLVPAGAKYRDGSFLGLVKDAKRGDTVVEVVLKAGKITGVNILMPTREDVAKEKYPPALEAWDKIPAQIKERNSTDGVDLVTKATSSSKKYLQAVEMALENAKIKPDLPNGVRWHDGNYVGIARDPKHGDCIVEVVIKKGKMAEVNVIAPTAKYMETYGYAPGREAYREMPQRILKAQSADVDIYTKATSSSKKYIDAVKDALRQAS